MKSVRVANERDRSRAIDALMSMDIDKPKMMKLVNAEGKRRGAQNSLMWLWNTYVGGVKGHDKNYIHAEGKLLLGVPILSVSDPEFGAAWSAISEHADYPALIQCIRKMDITSRFTVAQMTEYLNEYEMQYAQEGTPLPHPEDRYYEAMGYVR